MLAQTTAPARSYDEVRLSELRAPARSPYDLSFLYYLAGKMADLLYARLRRRIDHTMLDTLIMLYIFINRIETEKLIGIEEEALTDTVGTATKMIEWD